MSEENMDHIAQLQQRLYTRDPENLPKRKFGILHPIKQRAQSAWGATELAQEPVTRSRSGAGYKRFFVAALLFFLVALGAALFSLYRGAVTLSSKNVDVVILGNSFVGGGEELPIQVEVANKNAAALVNVTLVLNYPKGATDETGTDVVRIERQVGTVASGKTKSEDFTAVLYGEQGISRTLTAELSYQLQGSTATFQKTATFSVMISSSPVGLTVDVPSAVVSNQSFTLNVHNSFSGDKMLPNAIVRVEYPNGFVFQSATPAPMSGNNVWSLGDLQKGDSRTVSIQGKLLGEVGDEKAFRIYVGTPEDETSTKIAVAYNSVLSTLKIAQPFVAGTISINNSSDDMVALTIGSAIRGAVSWVNNSAYTITNPTFALTVGGGPVDADTIDASNSYYDSLTRTITWTPESDASLVSLAPGAKGTLPFTLTPTAFDKDITLSLSIKGSIPQQSGAQGSIEQVDYKTVRFASNLQFAAQSLYSIGPIKNSGPYPPKADTETSYTLMWSILPSENTLTNVIATATLPVGVNWTGVIVPSTESISFSPDTRVVTWNIGALPKSLTNTPKTRTVSFQVKTKPTRSMVGSNITLLDQTTVSATDTATQTSILTTRPALSTKFDTDPIYTEGADRVVR